MRQGGLVTSAPCCGAKGFTLRILTKWRREREDGILEGLTPQKRGPKVKADPLAGENQKLRRDNERLTDQLGKAEIVIDVQKKVAMLLGRPLQEAEAL